MSVANKSQSKDATEQMEETNESSLASVQDKNTQVVKKQSDIREHMSVASSSLQKNNPVSENKKKKTKKGNKKRRISTSPKDQNETKKGRQDEEDNMTDHEAQTTEYETAKSASSELESDGSYEPP